jgi:DNA modification methylase
MSDYPHPADLKKIAQWQFTTAARSNGCSKHFSVPGNTRDQIQFTENVNMPRQTTVADRRKYTVKDVSSAKQVALTWLKSMQLDRAMVFGLPEVDDRYHVWRVPLKNKVDHAIVGEVVIDAKSSLVLKDKSTSQTMLEARLLGRTAETSKKRSSRGSAPYSLSSLRNTIAMGDSEEILQDLPAQSIDLAFTSPPYFNARPEYHESLSYDDYLQKIRKVIRLVHHVLAEGRFFVMNVSPVLVRRSTRSEASRRIAVPFDMHRIFVEEGFDFIDDIIWVKPEGAGWATGRGRRFAADRNPLQYKPVPVTEYVLVYRKHTDRLIDWNIRSHPNQKLDRESQIGDHYEKTNIWKIKPAHDQRHPAIFPLDLARKVITYYSFKGDVVLDPFAGIGTTGAAATQLGRRFVLVEQEPKYVEIMRSECREWLGSSAIDVLTMNCPPIEIEGMLL